jgi:hypothetical protein
MMKGFRCTGRQFPSVCPYEFMDMLECEQRAKGSAPNVLGAPEVTKAHAKNAHKSAASIGRFLTGMGNKRLNHNLPAASASPSYLTGVLLSKMTSACSIAITRHECCVDMGINHAETKLQLFMHCLQHKTDTDNSNDHTFAWVRQRVVQRAGPPIRVQRPRSNLCFGVWIICPCSILHTTDYFSR